MNKLYLLLLCLMSVSALLSAQTQTWHTRFSPAPLSATFFRLAADSDRFLLNTDRAIVQIDRLGTVTGYVDLGTMPNSAFWITAALKKYSDTSGHPYFVVIRRGFPPNKDFQMAVYRPGSGLAQEVTFPDSLGSTLNYRPQVLELDDHTYLAFGMKYYRKIKYDEATGFTEVWSRPLEVSPVAVLEHNGAYILADELGRLQALDADGSSLWLHNHAFQFRSLKRCPDGFIGCGNTADKKAVAIKLNFDGTAVWTKTYPETIFYDIVPTADGGYAAAGDSPNALRTLVKLTSTGALDWAQEYADFATNSSGHQILELPEGGYLLAFKGKSLTHCIRTDSEGKAPKAEDAHIDSRRLKTATIQADFRPGASLFFDGSKSTFVSLADSNAATMLTFAPWIGGIDSDNTIRVAAADYSDQYKRSDYRAGSSLTTAHDFNRVWAINHAEIQNLRKDFLQNNSLEEPVPYDLLSWPGKGNPHLKYNLDFTPVLTDPALFPAPFVDANGDGLYNVYEGDYPQLKGDQMVWWAFTDSSTHAKTFGKALLVDLQVSAYAYDCLQNPLIDQSLFVDYELINRSENSYTEAFAGFFADPDLGCYIDDYIGSLPQVNSWYVYNQHTPDGAFNCQGVQGFGSNIPVQSLSFLSPSLDHTIYHLNPAFGTPPPGMVDPYTILGYYQNLRGRWVDGAPLTIGGSGYNQFNMNTTDYFFPDNPADPQGWTMCNVNLGYPDRRVVSSHGPFTFAAGDTFRVQLAFSLHRNIPHPCPDIFGLVVPPLEQLQTWHADAALDLHPDLAPVQFLIPGRTLTLDASAPQSAYAWSTGSVEPFATVSEPGFYRVTITGETGCKQVETVLVQALVGTEEAHRLPQWNLWPNPSTGRVFIDCPDCALEPLQALLYNAQGQVVRQETGFVAPGYLELHDLPAGLFWLELRGAAGVFGVRRVVVGR